MTTQTKQPKKQIRRGSVANKATIAAQFATIIPNMTELQLTIPQAKFAITYATNGFDSASAYREAFDKRLKDSEAKHRATWLLARDNIRAAVVTVISHWLNEKKIRLEQEIIQSYYAQAFYDPSMFINTDGSPAFETWDDIPAAWRCCVESIETKMSASGLHTRTVIKLVDRTKALDRLAKLTALAAMTTEPAVINQTTNVQNNITAVVNQDADTAARLSSIFSAASELED